MKTNKITSGIVLGICILVGLTIPREFGQIEEKIEYVSLSSVSYMEETKENYKKEIIDLKEMIDSKNKEITKWKQTDKIEDK